MIERRLTSLVAWGGAFAPTALWCGALVVGVAYAVRSARRSGLDPRTAYWAAMWAITAGLLGGRLLGLLVYRRDASLQWWQLVDGGRSYYGGLLAGAGAALLYLRARREPVLRHADAMAPACALGYFVGRWGCFFNGDDYGVLTDGRFAVRYPPATEAYVAQLARGLIPPAHALSLPVLPTQLLHAALGMALFWLLRRPRGEPGWRLGTFALGYGVGRFALEFARGDFVAAVGPMSLHQALSLGLIAVGALLWVRPARTTVAAG